MKTNKLLSKLHKSYASQLLYSDMPHLNLRPLSTINELETTLANPYNRECFSAGDRRCSQSPPLYSQLLVHSPVFHPLSPIYHQVSPVHQDSLSPFNKSPVYYKIPSPTILEEDEVSGSESKLYTDYSDVPRYFTFLSPKVSALPHLVLFIGCHCICSIYIYIYMAIYGVVFLFVCIDRVI